MQEKATPNLKLISGGEKEKKPQKSEKGKLEFNIEKEMDDLKEAEGFDHGEMMGFLEKKRKAFSDISEKLREEEFDIEQQSEPDIEDIWILYNNWKDFESQLKDYRKTDSQRVVYDSIMYTLKSLLSHSKGGQIIRANHLINYGEKPETEKEAIRFYIKIYKRWEGVKEEQKEHKNPVPRSHDDRIRKDILYPIMDRFIYLYEDDNEEAFRFVLDHFEDFSEEDQQKLFGKFEISPVNTDKYLKLTDKGFAKFKERLKEYKQTKRTGEMLKSNAHNMYDLLSLINQHVDRVVVERSFRNRSNYSKAYLIHEIIEEIRSSNPELLITHLGLAGTLKLIKKRTAEKAKMKLSKTGGHKLTRKVGDFNLRKFVLDQVSYTRAKVFDQLVITEGKVRPPIVSVNWLDLAWKAQVIAPSHIFRIPLKGPKGTTKIKTITGLDVIHCIEKLPLGESDLDILPSKDEIDPERITEEKKYLDIKFLIEIKERAQEIGK